MAKKILFLFDVDGTLTESRLESDAWMNTFLKELRAKEGVTTGFVGGSDLPKQQEQLGNFGQDVKDMFDYCFAENGLTAFHHGKRLNDASIRTEFDQPTLQKFINFSLSYIANLDIPVKTGCFVEFRTGMLNVCPVGRNCNQAERIAFYQYDQEHKVRAKMVTAIEAEFPDLKMQYSIGGQISFDCFPIGWDKTYCLQFVEHEGFDEIHFLGDKTSPGGNDVEIFEDSRTIGHTVTSPADTKQQVEEVLKAAGIV